MTNLTLRDIIYSVSIIGSAIIFYLTSSTGKDVKIASLSTYIEGINKEITELKLEIKGLRQSLKGFPPPFLLEKVDSNTYRIIILEEANKR